MTTWVLVGVLLIILGLAPLFAGLFLESESVGYNGKFLMTMILILGGLGVMASGIILLVGIWIYT